MNDSDLSAALREWGIDSEYVDARGRIQVVAAADLLQILGAAREGVADGAAGPAAVVVRRGGLIPLTAVLATAPGLLRWHLAGARDDIEGVAADAVVRIPEHLPVGCYQLRVSDEGAVPHPEAATVFVVPEQAYEPPALAARCVWTLAVQLYGVRSARNWGHGDFTDLLNLVRLAAALGAAGVALNPLHAPFVDRPEEASPYAPNSRRFLNLLYIDLEAVAEFPGPRACGLEAELARLRTTEMIDYAAVAAAKLSALRACYVQFRDHADPARRRDFDAFRAERGRALALFAAFEAARARWRGAWWDWPPEWREPNENAIARLRGSAPGDLEFHEYVQWLADRQLGVCRDEARRLGMTVGLFIDLAVGVDAAGADAWSDSRAFMRGVSLGAPPDLLNTAGQDWGLSPFNPRALERQAFAPFREMLDAAMRYGGAVRIDHVLGLNRVFLVPWGRGALHGTYMRFPLHDLLGLIALASHEHECLVIGEDLGTVPDGFRETLAEWNIWSYKVMLFERGADGSFKLPENYAERALVTFTTHDLSTFVGWLGGHDLRVKRQAGLDPGETEEERERARVALREALRTTGLGSGDRIDFIAVARFLARTPSRLMVISLEDALGIEDQPNVPGTTTEHPNWRRRMPVSLEDLAAHAGLRALAQALADEGRALRAPTP